MSSENKPIRKMLTTVQKVQLYNFLSKLQDSRKLREMTYDEIVRDAMDALPFPIGYGHVTHMLKETGWECRKAHKMITLTKSALAEEVKELSSRLEDLSAVVASQNQNRGAVFTEEWANWVEGRLSTFETAISKLTERLAEHERLLNMVKIVPPANTLRVIPPQGEAGPHQRANTEGITCGFNVRGV